MNLSEVIVSSINSFVPFGAVIFILVILIALAYMFGKSFRIVQFNVFAEEELSNLFITFILIILIPIIITLFNTLSLFLLNSVNINHASWDHCYAKNSVPMISVCYLSHMNTKAQNLINFLINKKFRLMQESAKYVSYYGLVEGTTYGPEAYKNSYASYIDLITMLFLVPSYVSIMSQYVFSSFFLGDSSFILTALLPGGFLLRLVKPFRMAGNYIIALSVGLYTLLPTIFSINGLVYSYTATLDFHVFNDPVIGSIKDIANLLPQAVLLPNFIIAIMAVYVSAINNALRRIT